MIIFCGGQYLEDDEFVDVSQAQLESGNLNVFLCTVHRSLSGLNAVRRIEEL